MLKKLLAIMLSAAVLCGFSGCSLVKQDIVDVTHELEVPTYTVFLGDSIAAGYGLDGYTDDDNYHCPDSYANTLAADYTTELADICTHDMRNFAVSGATSADLLELLRGDFLDSALNQADAVEISIGGNDLLHILLRLLGSLGISADSSMDTGDTNFLAALAQLFTIDSDVDAALEDFEVNLIEIADTLSLKTDGVIYIQTLYDPFEVFTDFTVLTDFSAEKIGRLNEIIREHADKYTVIDVAAEFDGKCSELTNMARIDIHPNKDGHAVIAKTIDKAFRETGFTCTTQEYGEPYLPISTILLIIGGFLGMLAVVLLIIPKLFKRYEE